jgi:EAL domain-containing protein (putative c-di-GMP-specific phosphodiesterase class I)
MASNRLLIIDDEPEVAAVIGRVARGAGYDTIVTTDIDDFLDRVRIWQPTVIALDLGMPDLDGLQVLGLLGDEGCKARILIVSGRDHGTMTEAVALGLRRGLLMAGILQKPLRLDELRAAFREIFEEAGLISKSDLADALQAGQFTLEYQPKVDIRTLCPVGVEALARWHHPTRGAIGPDTFIPLLEQSNVIVDFTRHVVDVAVAQARAWRDQGLRLNTAINISGRCWGALDVAELIVSSCQTHKINPDCIVLELTETVAMVNEPRTLDTMNQLARLGVGLSLDDFGTGYSSLKQLHSLPFSEIKIDRSFVAYCDTNDESRIIIESITDMAHNLGQKVVAEGIESDHVLRHLAKLGCDVAQGYYFARPMPAREIRTWTQDWSETWCDPSDKVGATQAGIWQS